MTKNTEEHYPEAGIDTVLASDINFKGNIKFKNSLKIKGKLDGTVTSEEGLLIIGGGAEVKANIQAPKVVHFGQIEGNIDAKEVLEISSKAKVIGDVSTKEIVIERGAVLHGSCSMVNTAKEEVKEQG